ncbi:MAG: hypothetical protein RL020_1746 [Pseudomonadota bacterium]|jgi:hypothetical protein
MKFILIFLASLQLMACTHGSGASRKDLSLARFSRTDLCCATTTGYLPDGNGQAFGCGKSATYAYDGSNWKRIGEIQPGSGSPENKLVVCTQ